MLALHSTTSGRFSALVELSCASHQHGCISYSADSVGITPSRKQALHRKTCQNGAGRRSMWAAVINDVFHLDCATFSIPVDIHLGSMHMQVSGLLDSEEDGTFVRFPGGVLSIREI